MEEKKKKKKKKKNKKKKKRKGMKTIFVWNTMLLYGDYLCMELVWKCLYGC